MAGCRSAAALDPKAAEAGAAVEAAAWCTCAREGASVASSGSSRMAAEVGQAGDQAWPRATSLQARRAETVPRAEWAGSTCAFSRRRDVETDDFCGCVWCGRNVPDQNPCRAAQVIYGTMTEAIVGGACSRGCREAWWHSTLSQPLVRLRARFPAGASVRVWDFEVGREESLRDRPDLALRTEMMRVEPDSCSVAA
jgi:hypothetical protein